MAKTVEDGHGTIQDSSGPERPGRVLPDAPAQNLLSATWFTLRFLGWCVRWTFAALLFLSVMGISAYFVFNQAVKGGHPVLVPDVTGLPITRAANVLSEAGLELGTQKQIMSDRVPEFHVIMQRPSANRVVREGRKVSLSISADRQYENAPNLVGKRLDQALQQLAETQLRPGSVARLSSDAPADTILAQDPEARAPISKGSEIHLLVSDGPKAKPIFMPDILGKSMEEAQLILASLDVAVVPYKVNRAGEEYEVVLGQAPEPGTLLRAGQEVSFDVRLLPSSFLPNARRLREVIYTVPQRPAPVLIRVELVDQRGESTLLYPKPDLYVDGRPPRLPSGYTITIPAIAFSNEATVEFFLNEALHTSYYFEGDADPVITVNQLGAAGGGESLVEQQELEEPSPRRRNPFRRRPNRPAPANP
ncbi:MAG: PASTA domain-containing protein [Candidatus Hydrogenedentes bacterium]|nr:PASTA domain-containing protein [Candidatus Hydrogenedentota bacterium]